METRLEPHALQAVMSRLGDVVRRIEATRATEESLRVLESAAVDLVGAERALVSAEVGFAARGDAEGFALPGSAQAGGGVLWVFPRSGAGLTDADRAVLKELVALAGWAIEHVKLRQRLVEQDERLRLALEAASLGTWEHVPATHATYWDARSKAIFGYAADEELDFESYVAALHPDDSAGVFAGITKAMDPGGSGQCSLQYRIQRRDGRERWVEAHGHCVFAGGIPQRINGTLLDITERKQAEEAVREAARRKDEFLAVLGHELRNPLAPIRTALEVLRLQHPDYAVREREVIDRQVRYMIRLVDDLLDVARVARGTLTLRPEPSELSAIVDRAVEIASPLFEERRHRLELDVPPGLIVDVDPVRFAQVIANLLTNAAKFTPSGGRVRVVGQVSSGEVLLAVEDDGIGIGPEHLVSIFEPFVQAGRLETHSAGGLGLGLSLVRALVELHGGSVAAESAGARRGSRFLVRLPAGSRLAEASPSSGAGPASAGRALRLLVVDDNEDAAEMLETLLGQFGHDVRIAHDGPRALAIAAEHELDIAVLDLGLPVMDGYELATRLLDAHGARGLRLVALTGYGQLEDIARTQAAGFHRHLVKPILADDLQATLLELGRAP